jgi:hypothetical protein
MRYNKNPITGKSIKKERLFKVLNFDPDLTLFQIQERFGVGNSVASVWRKEWREKKNG